MHIHESLQLNVIRGSNLVFMESNHNEQKKSKK